MSIPSGRPTPPRCLTITETAAATVWTLRPSADTRQRAGGQTGRMDQRRHVFLDPDGTMGPVTPWMYVVVEMETGVVYQQQYGGTATRHGQVEGYLVPVHAPEALDQLRDLFERTFGGSGAWDHDWSGSRGTTTRRRGVPPDQRLRLLREAVGRIPFWTSASDGRRDERHWLALDDSRLAEADEAWVPVRTPAGPGVLMWFNSD